MNKILKRIPAVLNHPKLLLVTGLIGIFVIFLSSLIPSGKKSAESKVKTISAEQYRQDVCKSVKEIVTGITGDKDPTVVITLESSVRYDYADAKESDTSESSGKDTEENRKATKQSFITVKSSDGGEQPLIVTEFMPEIRGVAIVCAYGDSSAVCEKIENAVTAALNITSQRVYVSGGISNEKG